MPISCLFTKESQKYILDGSTRNRNEVIHKLWKTERADGASIYFQCISISLREPEHARPCQTMPDYLIIHRVRVQFESRAGSGVCVYFYYPLGMRGLHLFGFPAKESLDAAPSLSFSPSTSHSPSPSLSIVGNVCSRTQLIVT